MTQRINWMYEHDDKKITFNFDIDEMNHKEIFMQWVSFMNAIGYTLDPTEMEAMWNGE